ncbi:MAG: ABC transporter ATP-binding protein [Lachnospiraceae bacterium]|nr:ABC transporter ATP-binding protein [Lachnospiraceae bacterium]
MESLDYNEVPLLEFRHVSGRQKKFGKKKFVLEDVNFALPKGFMMGVSGVNGAGKTTLVDYIIHPNKQYEGEILINGEEIHTNHTRLREKIAWVSEDNSFLEARTAKQNAELLGSLYENFDMKIFYQALQKMGMTPGNNLRNMSRGERMRFQIAFAMAHKPVLYVLDEVTAGMDPVFRIDFFRLMHEVLDEETSVLMVTHIEEELDKKMDYIGVMENGRMVEFYENFPEV